MAFDTVPFAMDSTTMDAEKLRRAVGTLIGSAGGIVTPGDCLVAQQASPNMSVQIAPGQVWIPGTSTASQGPYYSRNGAATTVVISASSPSNPRVDTIIAQAIDTTYAGTLSQVQPAVVIGTPTAGVSTPPTTAAAAAADGAGTVPASSLVLAYVLVPTSATSIVTADIANVVGVRGPAMAVPQGGMVAQTRVLETAYQPNTLRPTFVIVNITETGSQFQVLMDAANPPTTAIVTIGGGAGGSDAMILSKTFLVPPSYYYKFHAGVGSPAINTTFEYVL